MRHSLLFRNLSLFTSLTLLSACNPVAGQKLALEDPDFVPTLDDTVPTPAPSCAAVEKKAYTQGKYAIADLPDRQCAQVKLCVDPAFWALLSEATFVPGIDVVILFDVTGSMSPFINAMIQNVQQLINNLSTQTSQLKLGLASFQDFANRGGSKGDLPYKPIVPLTTDHAAVKTALGKLKAVGGGDVEESLATALRAIADGKGVAPYFGESDMGFSQDPTRVKIILGITDAGNKSKNLPAGAATLDQAIAALKERGILFLGIGRKPPSSAPNSDHQYSFKVLSQIAEATGAIVKTPGLDLNGNGEIDAEGEIAPGTPAVLQMDSRGNLLGAPMSSDPTRVLADAIAVMVQQTKPFQFSVAIESNGRKFKPDSSVLVVPPESTEEQCFSVISFDPKEDLVPHACAVNSPVWMSATEETTNTQVDGRFLKPTLLEGGCVGDDDSTGGGDDGTGEDDDGGDDDGSDDDTPPPGDHNGGGVTGPGV